MVLQLAKHFKKARQPRSIIIAFFGAEEQGLVGSKNFLEWMKKEDSQRKNLPINKKGIVAMVNLDMVGRMRDHALSVSGTGTSSSFKALAEQVAEEQNLRLWPQRPGIVRGCRHPRALPHDGRTHGVSHPCRRALDAEL